MGFTFPKQKKKTKYGTSNPKVLSVIFWKALPHMRALVDAAVFINKAARWASIKQVETLKSFLREKRKITENVWVLKFPNGPHFLF